MDYDHPQHIKCWNDVGDFKNRGTPKSSILMVFSIINHHLGYPHLWNFPLIFHHKPASYWGTPRDLTSGQALALARAETSDPRCPWQSLQCRPQVLQILLPKDARSTDILPDSGQTKDPAMWTGISLEHVSAQYIYIYICILYINK